MKDQSRTTTSNPPNTIAKRIGPREVAYSGTIIHVILQKMQLPGGQVQTFEHAERPPGVRIVVTDRQSILLTREWRHEHNRWDHRLPGGKVFDRHEQYEPFRENPDAVEQACRVAAARELRQETGLTVEPAAFSRLHVSLCGSTIHWDLYYFLAVVNSPRLASPMTTSEGECISSAFYPSNEIVRLFLNGEIGEDRSAAVLLRLILDKKYTAIGLPNALHLESVC
jgi:ADP-ribose pyrophosphatase YjhB (NUDIX family)